MAGGTKPSELLAGLLATSEDGVVWEDVTPDKLLPVYGVWGDAAGFQAVGWNGLWAESPDGRQWRVSGLAWLMHQCTFMLRPSYLFAVAASFQRTVTTGLVVGDQYPGVGVALAREDQGPWSCTVTEAPPHPFRFFAVARAGEGFVAAGLGGVASSTDGRHWQPELELPGVFVFAVATRGERWVAVGEGGLIAVRECWPLRRPRQSLRPARQ